MQPLETLKQQAIEAKKNLYLAVHPVKGTNLMLCWQGRIIRAHDLANEALVAKDNAKVEMLTTAIKQLQDQMDQASDVYNKALRLYQDAGGTDPLDVGVCTCDYCKRNAQQEALFLAESRLRRAVFDLTEPDEGGKPLPLVLMSQGTEDGQKSAWRLFVELCNAQANYARACEQIQKVPAWGYVLRAW